MFVLRRVPSPRIRLAFLVDSNGQYRTAPFHLASFQLARPDGVGFCRRQCNSGKLYAACRIWHPKVDCPFPALDDSASYPRAIAVPDPTLQARLTLACRCCGTRDSRITDGFQPMRSLQNAQTCRWKKAKLQSRRKWKERGQSGAGISGHDPQVEPLVAHRPGAGRVSAGF